ncbi:sulfotransferase [Labilibacter sediminis]|nr:sulfotransferase [Labilibacter sediminis]
MKKIQPIQMIGTQRSGTNLFRVMLNQLSEIAAPHPPHILQRFFPLLELYGCLLKKENFHRLAKDVSRLVEYNPVQWENVELNIDEIIDNCESNSLEALFYALYDKYAKSNDSDIWICKSMANVNFFNQLENANRQPLYIYLYRDGRDVACSFKKAIVGEKHIYHLAKKWKEDQEKCLALRAQLPANRFILISYEELIQDAGKVMERVCKFIGVEFKLEIFDYHQSKESKATASAGEMWGNVAKPVMNNNFNKYRKQLSREEILIFEHAAGDVLKELGYKLDYPEIASTYLLSEKQIAQFDKENDKLKEAAKQSIDPEGQERRKMQDSLLQSIKNQLFEKQMHKVG